ncbi:MAG: glutamine amidotransferase, partial [Kiritimatiellaeota bacterium]|nr:glutamine amidotransferase [Kiritimatiellota bacterium]
MKRYGMMALLLAVVSSPWCRGASEEWVEIPAARWKGAVVVASPSDGALWGKETTPYPPPLGGGYCFAVAGVPEADARAVEVAAEGSMAAGLYEVRLTMRPSHTNCRIAFTSSVEVVSIEEGRKPRPPREAGVPGRPTVASFPGYGFAVAGRPETRTFEWVHSGRGGLQFSVLVDCDERAARQQWVEGTLKAGIPPSVSMDVSSSMGGDWGLDLDLELSPENAVYYVLDKVEYRLLSSSARVVKVERDKIRYRQGETLKGSATIEDVGRSGGGGVLNLYLEHGVKDRVKVGEAPVALTASMQRVPFEFTLPHVELGYAVVAEFVSEDGKDRSEAKEYFTIANNFQRVLINGGGIVTRDAEIVDDEAVRYELRKGIAQYSNSVEYFAWAEDDMVGMSPPERFWSSGQTNYRMNKETIQRQIRVAHEFGFAVTTYGKAIMSGVSGWNMFYDYPEETRTVFNYPVGSWFPVDVPCFDRFRDQDFVPYRGIHLPGDVFFPWWSAFIDTMPDATPHWSRMMAEEMVRSVDMFGWDGVRWDGHPSGGGQTGCDDGRYDYRAARRTQTLVRHFKDIVEAKYPEFRHGYNYLFIEPDKKHDWAVEDFELDELCRGGGLLMNEGIGNASAGWTFNQIIQNLQVEGDLCRERGGYYLGISYAYHNPPRDVFIESALWAAAGCRPYYTMNQETCRYLTRYAQYSLDERLRRLVTPEKVLQPLEETRTMWDRFVYETPRTDGKSQLVINLLNIPLEAKRPREGDEKAPSYDMPEGTEEVAFALTLPQGMTATAAHHINPMTLEVTEIPLVIARSEATKQPSTEIEFPAVDFWQVIVIDVENVENAPTLASLYGPPVTFGVKRESVKDEERIPELVIDLAASKAEARAAFKVLEEPSATEWLDKRTALAAMPQAERDAAMAADRTPLDEILNDWQKGATTPLDLALTNKVFSFGDLAPKRNGVMDVYYARGAMDYRLRVPAIFGGLEKVRYHDAPFSGSVRSADWSARLSNAVSWEAFPEFDVLLYTSIPHQAIGAENAYAVRDYVKAGGSVLFTGGEYAFGRGGYLYTVLDREVLPIDCYGIFDVHCPEVPAVLEAGPDFAELGVTVDFSTQPRVWSYNLAAVRPGAKVFLKTGDIPILVGWELGEGRVLCLLTDYRGKAINDWMPFFDWDDWPKLGTAMLEWCAPDAYSVRHCEERSGCEERSKATQHLLKELKSASDDDLFADLDRGMTETFDLPDRDANASRRNLSKKELDKRVELLRRVLAWHRSSDLCHEINDALANQLAAVENLPCETRMQIAQTLKQSPSTQMGREAATALKSGSSALFGSAYLLMALAGDEAF